MAQIQLPNSKIGKIEYLSDLSSVVMNNILTKSDENDHFIIKLLNVLLGNVEDWTSSKTYNKNDIVRHEGSLFSSRQNTNLNKETSNGEWWQKLVSFEEYLTLTQGKTQFMLGAVDNQVVNINDVNLGSGIYNTISSTTGTFPTNFKNGTLLVMKRKSGAGYSFQMYIPQHNVNTYDIYVRQVESNGIWTPWQSIIYSGRQGMPGITDVSLVSNLDDTSLSAGFWKTDSTTSGTFPEGYNKRSGFLLIEKFRLNTQVSYTKQTWTNIHKKGEIFTRQCSQSNGVPNLSWSKWEIQNKELLESVFETKSKTLPQGNVILKDFWRDIEPGSYVAWGAGYQNKPSSSGDGGSDWCLVLGNQNRNHFNKMILWFSSSEWKVWQLRVFPGSHSVLKWEPFNMEHYSGIYLGNKDLNTILDTGIYFQNNVNHPSNALNYPLLNRKCHLRVVKYDNNYITQEITFSEDGATYIRTKNGEAHWTPWKVKFRNLFDNFYLKANNELPRGDLSLPSYWQKVPEGMYVCYLKSNYTNAPTNSTINWCIVLGAQRQTTYQKMIIWFDGANFKVYQAMLYSATTGSMNWVPFNYEALESKKLPNGDTKTSNYWATVKPGLYYAGSGDAGVINRPNNSAVYHVTTWGSKPTDKVILCYPATLDRKIYKNFFNGPGQTREWVRIGNDTEELNRWGDDRYLLKLNPLSTQDLNNIKTNGFYSQDSNANATLARNYPVANKAGSLIVKQTSANNANQEYTVYGSQEVYVRGMYNGNWQPWVLVTNHSLDIGDRDLNIITQPGNYRQHLANKVRLNQNYPVADKVGVLEVIQHSSNAVIQRYTVLITNEVYVRTINNSSISNWVRIGNDTEELNTKYTKLGSYLPDGDLSSVTYWNKIFEGFYVKNPNGNYTNSPTSANLSWCLVFANQRVTGYSKAMLWVDESLNQVKIGRCLSGSGSVVPWKLISIDDSVIKGNIRLNDENLNNIKKQGFYHQGYNIKATTANNYPAVNEAGYLKVYMMSGVGVLQEYTTYSNMQTYIRTMDNDVWKPWKRIDVNDEVYYNKNKRNGSKITTINGIVVNLSYSDNYIVNMTTNGVFGITEALVGQSGTIIVNNANRITGFGSNIKWKNVPTNLKQKEIFAYFVEDLNNIWMGRLV